LRAGVPEYEYPVPFVVRNTFIEAHVDRHTSLDEFFQERRIQSSPAEPKEREDEGSHLRTPSLDLLKSPEPQHMSSAIASGAESFMTSMAAVSAFWTQPYQEVQMAPAQDFNAMQQMPCVLRLSEALQGTGQLGSNEMPTVGSAGHHNGTCKPCAFLHTKGCENGTQCTFCHLCAPEEKRRRQKDKHEAFKEMRRQRRQVRL